MKTHKTASSAVQNIFLRQALISNYSVAIGRWDWARLCYWARFDRSCLYNRDSIPLDMMMHHLRYNKQEVASSLSPNATYITILRHPRSLIHSAFEYFEWKNVFGTWENYTRSFAKMKLAIDTINNVPFRNLMLYDFGLEVSEMDADDAVEALVEHVHSRFDVVMLQEYMHESLVLLRHTLNWSYEDVAVFEVNKISHKESGVQSAKEAMTAVDWWNRQDLRLYNRLHGKFQRQIENFGHKKMAAEVEVLKQVIAEIRQHCIKSESIGQMETDQHGEVQYELTEAGNSSVNCWCLTSSEHKLTRILWRKAYIERIFRKKVHVDLLPTLQDSRLHYTT